MKQLSRRALLKAGAALAPLPLFAASKTVGTVTPAPRLLIVHSFLGFHTPAFFPKSEGSFGSLPESLQPLSDLKNSFSLLSGLSHHEAGHGHAGVIAFTTGKHPARHNGRRSISIDQRLAESIGENTRFDSLAFQCSSGVAQGLSYTRRGTKSHTHIAPGEAYNYIFEPREADEQRQFFSEQDHLLENLSKDVQGTGDHYSIGDQSKFKEYQASIKELNRRNKKQLLWLDKPFVKPVGERPSGDVGAGGAMLLPQFLELSYQAFQTDSTRAITIDIPGSNRVYRSVKGVSVGHHGLSHHGQRPEKITQLIDLESRFFDNLATMMTKMKSTYCTDGSTLLDNTTIVMGSGLGNGSSHSTKDLPVLLAGGGFRHGQHIAYNQARQEHPFCNLYSSIMKNFNLKDTSFADSTGILPGIA